MKERILQPNQILVPEGYEVGREEILKIYFRVFDKGRGYDLPPSIVINRRLARENALKGYINRDRVERIYTEIEQSGADYFLIDGNHKGIAAVLCHVAPKVLELETDIDLEEARGMAERGGLFDFPHEEESLLDIADGFVCHVFTKDYVRTLQQRVDKLTASGNLPQYMKERYHKK